MDLSHHVVLYVFCPKHTEKVTNAETIGKDTVRMATCHCIHSKGCGLSSSKREAYCYCKLWALTDNNNASSKCINRNVLIVES